MHFDVLIAGGRIADGTGSELYTADLGLQGDTITAIGDLSAAQAARRIPAAGRVVSPGFIDIHTHSDTAILDFPQAESRTLQGVTTEVVGNCSYSPFPVTPLADQFLGPRLCHGAHHHGWAWRDLSGYRAHLEQHRIGLNIAPLVGHSAIRIAAMGLDDRPPTPDEIGTMQHLAAEAIEQGAFGFSTGLTLAPSSFSETPELTAISRAVAAKGGFYATHSRLWAGWHYRAVEESLEIGRDAGLPIQISHQTIVDPRYYGTAAHIVGMMEEARRQGIDVRYDVYPYTAGGTAADQLLPAWALEGGVPALLARLRDATTRRAIRDDAAKGWFRGIPWSWEGIQLVSLPHGDYFEFIGQRMDVVAERLKLAPLDALLHLIDVLDNDVSVVVFNRTEADVEHFLAHPLAMIGSDGTSIAPRGEALAAQVHPRFYGTFPRVLGRYCRERGIFSLAEAVHKMTAAPAARLGLKDRGTLRPGAKADITVFDPATIADQATFAHPHRYPIGIDHVLVNGKIVVTPEGHTGERPGTVLSR